MCGANSAVPSGVSRPSEHVMKAEDLEEVQQRRDIRTPDMPTRAEMAEHKDHGHAQYLDWCPDCVEDFKRE